MAEFEPHPLLRNRHLMTMVPAFIPRTTFQYQGFEHIFEVNDEAKLLAYCHVNKTREAQATLLIVHGLEGCSESPYVLGLTMKAIEAGLNVVRMNLRNCGGTLHLTKTLYNAGQSADVISIAKQLKTQMGFRNIFAVGFSLGGNIVLKAAGEMGEQGSSVFSGVCAVSPSIDLAACVDVISRGMNRIYELRFLKGLIAKIKAKEALFPGRYDVERLPTIKTIRQFDDVYTAPDGGYGNADTYYRKASAIRCMDSIRVPALIITAMDDPIVPFTSFAHDSWQNPAIKLLAPRYGGHGGFYSRHPEIFSGDWHDNFWAEHRIVGFCLSKEVLRD
ncbi:MAG TPA: alpha/beta fold hydrolase [Candidatus Obscuribacterales bacterium]